jgi:predicted AlkP superfamily phosphohydrolase/phosphomutase
VDILKDMNYSIDVDSNKAYKSLKLFIDNLFDVHHQRMKLYRYLWDEIKWDIFMIVFTGSDRLEHFMWDAFEDNNHEFHDSFLQYFKLVDEAIGDIKNRLSDDDKLLLLSDHGMERVDVNVNINTFLEREGMLKLGGVPKKRYNDIQDGSKCFSLDPARIYINSSGKYPKGFVKNENISSVKDEIFEIFSNFRYKGRKVINKIYKKEEIYRGRYIKDAPDVVLIPNSGFSLHAGIGKREIFQPPDIIKGKHTQPDAFLYVRNMDNQPVIPTNPCVENILSILDLN